MARKIPKRGIKRYKHAYNAGYAAGLRRHELANAGVSKFLKGSDEVAETATAQRMQPPTDTRVFKWEGFIEAMNLIIASKR